MLDEEPDPQEVEALAARSPGDEPDLARDATWVYEHIENLQAAPNDAPNLGAWGLLKWARANRNRFFEQLLPKAMAFRRGLEAESTARASAVQDAELSQMIEDDQRAWEEELVREAPATITRSVRSAVADWERRFALELPGEAAESLAAQMVGLTDKAVAALGRKPLAARGAAEDAGTVFSPGSPSSR